MNKSTSILVATCLALVSQLADADNPSGNTPRVVEPIGVFAQIDTGPTIQMMKILYGKSSEAQETLINEIKSAPDRFMPSVLTTLGGRLYLRGQKEDGLFWLAAGHLRMQYDAQRCADRSAAGAVNAILDRVPLHVRKDQFSNLEQLKARLQRLMEWDKQTPYNYDHRWINLHGAQSMAYALGATGSPARLSIPQEEWPELAQKNREEFSKSYFEQFERLRSEQSQK